MVDTVHGGWYNARTYPTVCRYCGAQVFHFSCDCGCKVFFDALGAPWPRHICLPYVVTTLGTEVVAQAVAEWMMTPRLRGRESRIDPDYAKAVEQRRRSTTPQWRLVRQDPIPDAHIEGVGYLREITPVDVFDKMGIPRYSLVGQRLLGKLAEVPHVQITLHTGDLSRQDGLSYTCFIQRTKLDSANLKRGNLVWFSPQTLCILGKRSLWLCDVIEHLSTREGPQQVMHEDVQFDM